MDLLDFIHHFDFDHPDFTHAPPDFPNSEPPSGIKSDDMGKLNAILGFYHVQTYKKPNLTSREWQTPVGYRFLTAWTNAVLLRLLVRKFTATLVPSPPSSKFLYNPLNSFNPREYRFKAQLDDAARSTVANIEEGWKRPDTKSYLEFLGFSQGSLEEVKGDTRRALEDGFLKSHPGSSLASIGIDLQKWHDRCKNPHNDVKLLCFPLNSFKGTYRILKEIKGADLTFEIFLELINKTDWSIRQVVKSLEKR